MLSSSLAPLSTLALAPRRPSLEGLTCALRPLLTAYRLGSGAASLSTDASPGAEMLGRARVSALAAGVDERDDDAEAAADACADGATTAVTPGCEMATACVVQSCGDVPDVLKKALRVVRRSVGVTGPGSWN